MLVGIINYGLGNTKSVKSAFEFLDYEVKFCQNEMDFQGVTHLVIPGVGSFNRAYELLKKHKLIQVIKDEVINKRKPTLGICLGLQLMSRGSFENGYHQGMGFFSMGR